MAALRPFPVLIVEDTPDDERLALRALQRLDVPTAVHVVRDGEEAIEYLDRARSESSLPELVLLDLKVPKVNGIEVLKNIRETPETAWLPVVILTSSDEQRDLTACYHLHCNAYVRKAVNYNEYMDAMKTTLEFWLTINRTPSQDHLLVGG